MKKLFLFLIPLFIFSCNDDIESIQSIKQDSEINRKNNINLTPSNQYLFFDLNTENKKNNEFNEILKYFDLDSVIVQTIVKENVYNYAIKLTPNNVNPKINELYNLIIHREYGIDKKMIVKFTLTNYFFSKLEILYSDPALINKSSGGSGCYVLAYAPCDYGHWHSDEDCEADGWKTKIICPSGGGGDGGGSGNDNTDYGPIIPGGYNPAEGGGGGGGTTSPPNDACKSLNNKLKNDSVFKQKLADLKPKINDLNYEHGFANTNPKDNPNLNTASQNAYLNAKSATEGSINFGMSYDTPQFFGFAHTHPTKDSSLGVPSFADIRTFLTLLKSRADNGLSNNDSYGIVVGNYGIYSMKLENNQNFLDVYNNNTSSTAKEFWKRFGDKYEELKGKYFPTLNDINKNKMEQFIADIFKQFYHEIGIVMYRMTDNMNGWEKLELENNGNLKRTICK